MAAPAPYQNDYLQPTKMNFYSSTADQIYIVNKQRAYLQFVKRMFNYVRPT